MEITTHEPPTPIAEVERSVLSEAIVEIVSDSGEGAQKCGQSLGAISAKMGNGVWTVEIIPAEIQPPARSRAGASGIRVRMGSNKITNMGDHAQLVVALNEQVIYDRIEQRAYKPGTFLLIEDKWKTDNSEKIRQEYAESLAMYREMGAVVYEIPMEVECLKIVRNARKGKNMWVLGMLCNIYDRDIEKTKDQIKYTFRKKSDEIVNSNIDLMLAGYEYANQNLDLKFQIPANQNPGEQVVMNGNEAISLGVMAAGIDVCSMYPITPATSASHHLAEAIEATGVVVPKLARICNPCFNKFKGISILFFLQLLKLEFKAHYK